MYWTDSTSKHTYIMYYAYEIATSQYLFILLLEYAYESTCTRVYYLEYIHFLDRIPIHTPSIRRAVRCSVIRMFHAVVTPFSSSKIINLHKYCHQFFSSFPVKHRRTRHSAAAATQTIGSVISHDSKIKRTDPILLAHNNT